MLIIIIFIIIIFIIIIFFTIYIFNNRSDSYAIDENDNTIYINLDKLYTPLSLNNIKLIRLNIKKEYGNSRNVYAKLKNDNIHDKNNPEFLINYVDNKDVEYDVIFDLIKEYGSTFSGIIYSTSQKSLKI
jgi:regulatory protein YycI of two-component signal transduction system YycFG